MAAIYTYEYTVTGTGPFPFDMLRYDRAWPVGSDSVLALGVPGGNYRSPMSVTLAGLNPPTEGRWSSFGWKVSEQTTKRRLA